MKKGYRGFVLWMCLFLAGMFAMCFLPTENEGLVLRATLNYTSVGIAVLTGIIVLADRIDWYNGVDRKQAEEAGPERRRVYAVRHFRRFAAFAAGFLLFSTVMHVLGLGFGWDIAVFVVGLIAVAVSTISIRL